MAFLAEWASGSQLCNGFFYRADNLLTMLCIKCFMWSMAYINSKLSGCLHRTYLQAFHSRSPEAGATCKQLGLPIAVYKGGRPL